MWFIGQLLKEPPLPKHLFRSLSLHFFINPSWNAHSMLYACMCMYSGVSVYLTAHSCVWICIRLIRYVLIPNRKTAVQRGRLALSESVYLNSAPSLSARPSINCLEWATHSYVLSHTNIQLPWSLKYDVMTVLEDCLSLLQMNMHCCFL